MDGQTMNQKPNSCEPFYFVGLVLRGTEQQYVNLLKYLDGQNGAQVIYQCKSLTYLRVQRDEPAEFEAPEGVVVQ